MTTFAWLVELQLKESKQVVYFGVTDGKGSMLGWVTNPNKALRFAREQDAQAMIDDYRWPVCKAVEHGWDE